MAVDYNSSLELDTKSSGNLEKLLIKLIEKIDELILVCSTP